VEESISESRSDLPRDSKGRVTPARSAAERKRDQRQRQRDPEASTVGGQRSKRSRGNPLKIDLGGLAKAGEPVSADEARRELKHAHVALAKSLRSKVDLDQLEEEFETAGEAFATTANHLVPALRLLPRLIAPLVLVGCLIVIWGAILVETPWLERVKAWRERRAAERAAAQAAQQGADQAEAANLGAWTGPPQPQPPAPGNGGDDHPPVPDVRRMRQR